MNICITSIPSCRLKAGQGPPTRPITLSILAEEMLESRLVGLLPLSHMLTKVSKMKVFVRKACLAFLKPQQGIVSGAQKVVAPPHLVVADEGGEVWRLQDVDQVHKLGAVEGVQGRERAAREHAQLQELRDGLVLGRTCRAPAKTQTLQKTEPSNRITSKGKSRQAPSATLFSANATSTLSPFCSERVLAGIKSNYLGYVVARKSTFTHTNTFKGISI